MKKHSTFKKATMLLSCILLGISVNAATITVSSAAETAGVNYNTIQAAYDYIKGLGDVTPIEEAYVIEIQNSYAGETSYPIDLVAIAGASETNTITIKPATGAKINIAAPNQTVIATGLSFDATTTSLVVPDVTGLSTSSYVSGQGTYASGTFKQLSAVDEGTKTLSFAAGTFTATKTGATLFFGPAQTQTIKLNGAKYVVIDGVSRTDANTGLTISNPNCIYAQTIFISGNAQYNTIKNCIVRGANQTAAWSAGYNGTIFFSGGNYNTISMNDVCDMDDVNIPMPICAFQITGQGANFENVISENNVYNISNSLAPNGNYGFFQFGSTYNTGSYNNSILNNKIFWTKTTPLVTGTVVVIGTGGNMNGIGNRFEGNTIGYANANGTGNSVLDAAGATLKVAATLKNFTCKNNKIANIEMTGTNFTGFEFGTSNASTPDANDVCSGNTVENIKLSTTASGTLQAFVINVANPYSANIKNNIVRNLTIETNNANNTVNLYGFQFTGTYAAGNIYKYMGNEVSNLTCGLGATPSVKSGNVYGIRANIVDLFEKNLIYNLNANYQAYVRAMRVEGNNSNPVVIQNNIIRVGTGVTDNANIMAVQMNSTSTVKYYNNTFYIGGQCNSDAASTVNTRIITYFTGSPTLELQNNIFCNYRTGGSSLNGILYTSAGKVTVSNNNLYVYNGEFGNNGTAYATFNDWKTASSLEAGSLDNVDPLFVDATAATPDMHLSSSSPANMAGELVASVTDDFAGATRADYSPTDLGAYVIASSTAVSTPEVENSDVYTVKNALIFNNLSGNTVKIYSINGQLLKSKLLTADKASVPSEKGIFIVNTGKAIVKVIVR